MATTFPTSPGDTRRGMPSPRPKGRETKNTLCRNVTIYGHCRYENTCPYVHDQSKLQAQNENAKKRFNVDSPSFTPLQPATNGITSGSRSANISPKAVNAAVFTPKSQRSNAATPVPSAMSRDASASDAWATGTAGFPAEFVPGVYDAMEAAAAASGTPGGSMNFDPFSTASVLQSLPGAGHQTPMNSHPFDASAALNGTAFYQNTNNFTQPLQYHLYAPMGPHRENLLPYQRTAHDFFIPEQLREELQRKAEATRQILPNSALPNLEHFHSLVPLDLHNNKSATLFGYPSWIYKAVSAKDGNVYALRRIEGFRLTNEMAIRSMQTWKRINNANLVTIHDVFTTRAFGDSSLIIVTDYHPLSKTLVEQHAQFANNPRFNTPRPPSPSSSRELMWSYIVQLANALKAIHDAKLAARVIHPSKILVTGKNRIRLNACAIMDILQYESSRPIPELQQDDLFNFGKLILHMGTNNWSSAISIPKALEAIGRTHTEKLKKVVEWLVAPSPPQQQQPPPTSPGAAAAAPAPQPRTIDAFLQLIPAEILSSLDSALHAEDTLTSVLAKELENGRLVRLMAKLGFINERPEYDHNPAWSETGERYVLKLFRDYVFHQVDANGNPVTDLAHVVGCLNKLDAGSDEKVALVTRDEQSVVVVSYRELKRGVEAAWQELVKNRGGRN